MGKKSFHNFFKTKYTLLKKAFFSPAPAKRFRYGVAIVAACSAIFVRLVFLPALGDHVTYVTFYPAVMVAALYGGFRAGVLAALLSAILADYFLMAPPGSLTTTHPGDWLGVAVFLFGCTFISYIAEAMHRFQRRAIAAETEIQHAAERLQAEEALRKSDAQFRMLFDNACDGIFIVDQQGRYADANVCGLDMLGLSRQEVLGRSMDDIFADHTRTRLPEAFAMARGGHPHIEEWQFVRHNGSIFFGEINAQLLPDGRMVGILRDITDRKVAQKERDLTIEFLRMVNVSKNSADLLHAAVTFFKENLGCDAVGIRVREDNDYPYRESVGFSQDFLQSENSLCECCHAGETPSPACLCGKVITGRCNPVEASFTKHGTYWSNDTSELLAIPFSSSDQIRRKCISEGYGTVALLPLHEGSERMGLLQLNFLRKGALTPEAVSLGERLTGHLAVAISKFRIEDALRTSEDLNRRTLQALPAHIAVIDRQGRIIIVNSAWTEFARDNAVAGDDTVNVGKNYLEVCRRSIANKDADAPQALAGIEAVLAGAWEQFNMEYPCHSPQEKRWFLMTVAPFGARGEGGAVIAHLNITARKQAEEALRESEARFRNIFDHAATGIAIADCGGQFVQCNAAYCDLTGYSQAELATMEFSELIHPEDREHNMRFIRQLLDQEIPSFDIENRYLRKSGDPVWIHKYVSLLRDDQGQPTHIIALVTDMTERKQTEDVFRFLGQCGASSTGETFFQELARYLAQSLAMDFVCIDRLEEDLLSAHTLAVYHNGTFEDNVSYTLKDTPCGAVVGRRICCYPRNVRGLFKKDAVLQTLQAESYLGTTLWSSQGKPIGLIALIGRQPLADTRRAESILQMVAVRAAGELERQQAEAELRESKKDLNRAQAVAHVGSWRLNVQSNELLWSDENWLIFGLPAGTPLTYETFLGTIHPDDRAYVHERWAAALRGEPYDIEHRIVIGDTVKWVRERAELEVDATGTLLGGFGTTQDITEHKRNEAVKARYELIAQYARDPLLLVDLHDNIIEVNEAAARLYGYTRDELLTLKLQSLRQDAAEAGDLQLQHARTDGILFESVHVCKDGNSVPVEVSSRGVVIAGKEMMLSVIRDIRQRKETELTLRRAKVEAERASQAKSDFLASVSHELRTPLNAVMGFSQVLGNEYFGPLTDKQKEYVNDIYESGKHLLDLINDILDLSKIEAGKMEPFWSQVNVENLLANSLVLIREKCAKHSIRLEFSVDETVRGLFVTADERRLKQVLYNLLSNASKFTPDGGAITLEARRLTGADPNLEVSISDTGIGIAAEHHEKVFEAFYQVRHGTANKTPGTGLGLSLVRQLVAMHGGRIWVTSEGEGHGSRFTFVIPVKGCAAHPSSEGNPDES